MEESPSLEAFYDTEFSLPYRREPATGIYPDPAESS
jgi:hypothetical protein